MTATFLVLNVGSSSIKFALYPNGSERAPADLRGLVSGIGTRPELRLTDGAADIAAFGPIALDDRQETLTERLLEWLAAMPGLGPLAAVGHRVVHGGTAFEGPVRIDADVMGRLAVLEPLAPLHQPFNIAAIRAVAARHPDLPQIACFDTSFHRTQDPLAQAFALPRDLTEAGIRRYGFHGLSYEYVAGELPDHLGKAAEGRVIVAHLGNGASLCAMRARRSVATTMGFTALDGLMMGRRCGALDPGVVLHMLARLGLSPQDVEDVLYRQSGLLGVSGLSSDMRTLEESDDPRAEEAIELFCYRAATALAGLVASLGGLDAIVFTAGIGENAPRIRARICDRLGWLGLALDPAANSANASRISTACSRCSVSLIPTDEERVIVRAIHRLCG